MSAIADVSAVCKRLKVLYDYFGSSDYIGEAISITEHSVQAAYFAHRQNPDDNEVIVASLLHDIGHVVGMEAGQALGMNGCGINDHEHVGADFLLKLGFPNRVCNLVRSHVQAKRYLCAKSPEYYTQLSDASKTTLSFQGGPMSGEEMTRFEADPDFQNYLNMRTFDENAKLVEFKCPLPTFEHYFPLIDSLTPGHTAQGHIPSSAYVLSEPQLQHFRANGFVKISNLLAFDSFDVPSVAQWAADIASWPKSTTQWLSHFEITPEGNKVFCRSENFVDFHEGMASLARGNILNATSQLFGEQSVLFKEKINYKNPGGAGFACHQDTPAYIGLANDHISVMVAIDDATALNGCLQVARGVWVKGQVPLNEQGVVTPEAEALMAFELVEARAGDVLLFSGYIPHRSESNRSADPRRALFLTFNPLSQGDHHAAYYEAKHAHANGFDGAHTISFQGDFLGKVVD